MTGEGDKIDEAAVRELAGLYGEKCAEVIALKRACRRHKKRNKRYYKTRFMPLIRELADKNLDLYRQLERFKDPVFNIYMKAWADDRKGPATTIESHVLDNRKSWAGHLWESLWSYLPGRRTVVR